MQQHVSLWKVEEMARVLGVSRSGYYHFLRKSLTKYQQAATQLASAIQTSFVQSRQTYGSPRIHAELLAKGYACSRPRVARFMKKMGLSAKMNKRHRKRTTQVNPKQVVAPNVLNQNFTAEQPNEKWVADISYVRTMEGWLYIAVVLDLFSRKVVGLSMADSLQTSLVVSALQQALQRRQPKSGLVHHSDRGCQYTSHTFQALLEKQEIICSMSASGYCFDNAAMESFFHTLKTECVYLQRYETRQEAKASIFEYIEIFYNNQRRHSTLGYASPVQFEQRYFQQLCPVS